MRIVVTEDCLSRIEEITDFLFTEQELSIEKIEEIIDGIFDKIATLSNQPYKLQAEPYLKSKKGDYRRLVHYHYKILYRVEEEVIYVTDVFDSRQDPRKMKW